MVVWLRLVALLVCNCLGILMMPYELPKRVELFPLQQPLTKYGKVWIYGRMKCQKQWERSWKKEE